LYKVSVSSLQLLPPMDSSPAAKMMLFRIALLHGKMSENDVSN
jgi:hypothetical protein